MNRRVRAPWFQRSAPFIVCLGLLALPRFLARHQSASGYFLVGLLAIIYSVTAFGLMRATWIELAEDGVHLPLSPLLPWSALRGVRRMAGSTVLKFPSRRVVIVAQVIPRSTVDECLRRWAPGHSTCGVE